MCLPINKKMNFLALPMPAQNDLINEDIYAAIEESKEQLTNIVDNQCPFESTYLNTFK